MPTQATISAFINEPYSDFARPDVWMAAQAALAKVRGESGREYPLWIAGAQHRTGDFLISTNPSHSAEIVGRAHKATATLAAHAVKDAHAYFVEWRRDARAPVSHSRDFARSQVRIRRVVGSGGGENVARGGGRNVGSHRLLRILRP